MNNHFENKKEYKYLKFDKRNKLVESGITDNLFVEQPNEFWHSFGSIEQVYDVQGQILGNMIIFSLKDSSKFIVYLNNVPEEYREYKFEVDKKYNGGLTTYSCVGIFDYKKNKIAVFKSDLEDEFYAGIIKKIENCEVCETEYDEFRADECV